MCVFFFNTEKFAITTTIAGHEGAYDRRHTTPTAQRGIPKSKRNRSSSNADKRRSVSSSSAAAAAATAAATATTAATATV